LNQQLLYAFQLTFWTPGGLSFTKWHAAGMQQQGPVFHVRSQTGTNVSLEASEKHKKKMDQGQKDNEKKSRVYSMTTYILPGIM
jgi:hypothetical protein